MKLMEMQCQRPRASKILELIAIDLDVDAAFELAQIQRQLSRWYVSWIEVWATDVSHLEISTLTQTGGGRWQLRWFEPVA